ALPAARFRLPAYADALALADGVEREPDVRADAHALGRHDRPGLARQVAVEELAERPFADEADPGRILFRMVRQPGLGCERANLGFLQFAQRKQHPRELGLVQAVQE